MSNKVMSLFTIFFTDESVRAKRPKSSTYHCEGKLGKVLQQCNIGGTASSAVKIKVFFLKTQK